MPDNPPYRMPKPVLNTFTAIGDAQNVAQIGPGKFSVEIKSNLTTTTGNIRLLCSLDGGTSWSQVSKDASGTIADYAVAFTTAGQLGIYIVGEALESMLLKTICTAIGGATPEIKTRIAQGPIL